MTLVKVCGLRTLPEAQAALDAGANLLGFIFWKPGKRYIPPTEAAAIVRALRRVSPEWSAVGVFVDPTVEEVDEATSVCGLDYIQLSGHESLSLVEAMPLPTVKAVHVKNGQESVAADLVRNDALKAHMYLLDTHADGLHGGTGTSFDWVALRPIGPKCLVAGGLRPDNVAAALAALSPLGVDVSSGVEFPNGAGKDPRLIRAFLEAVRTYDKRSH
jgi:phosphoribosylanthranilate isomerase